MASPPGNWAESSWSCEWSCDDNFPLSALGPLTLNFDLLIWSRRRFESVRVGVVDCGVVDGEASPLSPPPPPREACGVEGALEEDGSFKVCVHVRKQVIVFHVPRETHFRILSPILTSSLPHI